MQFATCARLILRVLYTEHTDSCKLKRMFGWHCEATTYAGKAGHGLQDCRPGSRVLRCFKIPIATNTDQGIPHLPVDPLDLATQVAPGEPLGLVHLGHHVRVLVRHLQEALQPAAAVLGALSRTGVSSARVYKLLDRTFKHKYITRD